MPSNLQQSAAWEASTLGFLWRQWMETVPPTPASVSLDGQTAIVTGSNAGLGFECAKQLLSLNLSHLILAVRSQSNGDEAARTLRKQYPSAKIDVSIVDMASYKSIIAFSKRCASLPRLDIAILNAGLSKPKFERAEETKHEMTFQVNYLSTALLAILLLPILKVKRGKSPSRMTLVGSDTAYWASWEDNKGKNIFEVVDEPSRFTPIESYKTSKLFLQLFLNKLSQFVPVTEVIVNVSNPGLCKGPLFGADNMNKLTLLLCHIVRALLERSYAVGARQYIDATTTKRAESHGAFVSEGKVKPFPGIMYGRAGWVLQEVLWQETMQELAFAHPTKILIALNE